MAAILACGQAGRPNERGELAPRWLEIVVVLEELGDTHTAGSEETVLTPRHSGQSATVTEGLMIATLRAPRDGPANRSAVAP